HAAARTTRNSAQRDGAPRLQALVDADRAVLGRAQHLCAISQLRAADPVLAVAAYPRAGLDRAQPDPRGTARRHLLARLSPAGGQHISDQSFRAVRAQPGVRALVRQTTIGCEIPRTVALPACPSPDLSRHLARRL